MVPTLTWGLVRAYFSFPISNSLKEQRTWIGLMFAVSHGTIFSATVLETKNSRHLESVFIRINIMVGAKVQRDFDVHHWVARQHARGHGLTNAFLYCWNELARHHATLDGVNKLNPFARFIGFNLEHHVPIL